MLRTLQWGRALGAAALVALLLVGCGGQEPTLPAQNNPPLEADAPGAAAPTAERAEQADPAVQVEQVEQADQVEQAEPVEQTAAAGDALTDTPPEDAGTEAGSGAGTASETTGDNAQPTEGSRVVVITEPVDGSEVTSPVQVCADARLVTSGASSGGSASDAPSEIPGAHVIVMVDPSGQEIRNLNNMQASAIPPGDRYIHFPDDADCTEIELGPGPRILVALVADEAGRPLNPQQTSRIQVRVLE